MIDMINSRYRSRKKEINTLIGQLDGLVGELNDRENSEDLKKIRESLDKPFMFVIIGEVKSGKSSFINALLGEAELCKTDVSICTDKITQLFYSEEDYEKLVEDNLLEIGTNKEILKEISIVDTPGTNSMAKNHELITKSFVPQSDLIIFVFPAYNPHQKSAWEILEYINKDWKKNVIFVCQQSDRSTPVEIEINTGEVRKYAIERGIADPKIFVTSAKKALEDYDEGTDKLKDFISCHVTDGRHIRNKLKDKLNGTEIVRDKVKNKVKEREEVLEGDRELRDKITTSFEIGEKRSIVEMENIIGRLLKLYLYKVEKYCEELEGKLSTGNLLKQIVPGIKKDKLSPREMEEFSKRMREEIEKELAEEARKNAAHFIDGVKEIFTRVIDEVDYELTTGSKERVYDDFYKKREEVFLATRERLEELADEENFLEVLNSNIPQVGSIAIKGGVVTVAGTLLAFLTQNAYLDMTGGIMAAAGILGTTFAILFKRHKIIKEFRAHMNKSGEEFRGNLEVQLTNTLNILYEEINRSFSSFDEHIEKESMKIEPLKERLTQVDKLLIHIKDELK